MAQPSTAPDEYAQEAAEVAAKLRAGSYDSVQALALLSIAGSLARIAEALEQPGDA